ncbi:pancreatic lipase-related protein 2-like isoform X2 [Asterias rubens]|uniref:pancreatic lipase-related protein 2-like isoform X2 n=1 Tax=Asterias rubens TaxID=7604 RepID=UPI0014552DC2|nr:pancreatic lipase-related protein 2-like isoform X2 [Asterias rubens]
MIELTRILIGSLVLLLMVNESYQTRCYNSRGVRHTYGRFCFDTSLSCWSGLNPAHLSDINNEFYLFTRQYNSDRRCYYRQKLYWDDPNTFDSFHSYKKTIVIIHGWQTSVRNKYFMSLCHSFMKLDNYNIIMVSWPSSRWSRLHYQKSVMDIVLVAKELALLLEELHERRGLQYEDVHMLGHSLGAHLAGYTGMFLHGQIGRISGLDPARPGFRLYLGTSDCHLDRTDADFVDVIHTDGLMHLFGLLEPVGHQDFYPNPDYLAQPSCVAVHCSHMRAIDYYLSSMKNFYIQPGRTCSFATKRRIWQRSCSGTCPRMGIHAEKGDGSGRFVIRMDSNNCGYKFLMP